MLGFFVFVKMTTEEIKNYWASTYPNVAPIGYLLRTQLYERWFRIHSLPQSQRYPNGEEDWGILLSRQNAIFDALLGEGADMIMITGNYRYARGNVSLEEHSAIKHFDFAPFGEVALDLLMPGQYEEGDVYITRFVQLQWGAHKYDEILMAIAIWELAAFFVSVNKQCIIAPYDGGMDIILKNSETRDYYKSIFKTWLSSHKEGL